MKIGLEIHCYPRTNSKMYCECSTSEAEPNINICSICTGQPGSKPMSTNKEAIKKGIMIAKALNCKIINEVETLRKHYFYPDLPNNYQRTSKPFGINGSFQGIRIQEVHWEEDAGRYDLRKGLVDFNRSGIPLIEIVTAPQIKSPKKAREFLNELRLLLSYLDVDKGIFKVDTNISLGSNRVEIKNINSIRGVEQALLYEIERQSKLLIGGKLIARETRHFDETTGKTISLREKETTEDYRFIVDPDIPIISLKNIQIKMPRGLEDVKRELIRKGLSNETIYIIVCDRKILEIFEKLSVELPPNFVANWIKKDLIGELSYRSISFTKSNVRFKDILPLLKDLYNKKITPMIARKNFRALLDKKQKIKMKKFSKKHIINVIDKILKEHPIELKHYRKGKKGIFNFFLGEVSKELYYSVDPKDLIVILKKRLM